jgi:thioesterase domain-containing protein
MIDAPSVEGYLHEHIPLSQAMGVAVVEATPQGVTLSAPLGPNLNHRGTVFGGSAAAVAILSAWSLLYLRLREEQANCNLVIQKSVMSYECPITGPFTASASVGDPVAWTRFLSTLRRKNRARIRVTAIVRCGGEAVGRLDGDYVGIGL